jgi:hypothetical protein
MKLLLLDFQKACPLVVLSCQKINKIPSLDRDGSSREKPERPIFLSEISRAYHGKSL